MKSFFLLLILSLAGFIKSADYSSKIKNVVWIMYENRPFDHMLGYLKKLNPEIDGLTGNEFNYYDPQDPSKGKVQVSFDQTWSFGLNPTHSLPGTEVEMWGDKTFTNPAPMNGFVKEMAKNVKDQDRAGVVMRVFNHTMLPTIQTLAMEFGVCDHFFSSVPGPTGPNRLYALSGTSHGSAANEDSPEIEGFPQRTIFDDFYDAGKSFRVYYSDFPISLELRRLRDYPEHIELISDFYDDAKAGTLPAFSFIEPRWFKFLDYLEQSEHPYVPSFYESGDIYPGEFLLNDIYKALRASPQWNDTLFIVSYDEHGGLYDHVSPPQVGVPNPDGLNSTNPPFGFDRLGVRVPFVVASPWINKKTVYHYAKDGQPLDHTSVMHTIRKIFGMKSPPLTKREAWSGTFEDILDGRTTPRVDCPMDLPIPPALQDDYYLYEKLEGTKESKFNIEEWVKNNPNDISLTHEISDLQLEIVRLASGVTNPPVSYDHVKTIHDGAVFVRQQMKNYLIQKNQLAK